jgi:hypothetical protein
MIKGSSGVLEKARRRREKERAVGSITRWVLCNLLGYWNEFVECEKEQIMTFWGRAVSGGEQPELEVWEAAVLDVTWMMEGMVAYYELFKRRF